MTNDKPRRPRVALVVALVASGAGLLGCTTGHKAAVVPTTPSGPVTTFPRRAVAPQAAVTGGAFTYGFDFTNQAPDAPGTDPAADARAINIMKDFAGSVMDVSLMGFGSANPEQSPGQYNMSSLAKRVSLIESVGGVPVITLIGVPDWMKDNGPARDPFFKAPAPNHYQDFAELCAYVARSFPQVKNFVVWNEMKGFIAQNVVNYQAYTAMYNVVYPAIKKVRPDALVGGPYAIMTSTASPKNNQPSTVNGRWGYLDQSMLDAVTYWLQHKVGADFLAVDGATSIAKADDPNLTDPLTASEKYGAVDQWIRSQTPLPIWWMESHIQPTRGWSDQQAAAARVATLGVMAASTASMGLQWQPQGQSDWPDEGLWTSTLQPGGGQPTTLAKLLPQVLPVLKYPFVRVSGEPTGVLVGRSQAGALLVNTLDARATATLDGAAIDLGPAQVIVK